MKISVKFVPAMIATESELRNCTVVVIDVLRATSTIVAALMAGAREVVPAGATDEAVDIAHRLGTERTLLCGEQGAVKVQGFHLGNSPSEYTPEAVHGKTIVLTTTNGAPTLLKARQADHILCGALLNARATAMLLARIHPPAVVFLCSGTHGEFSLEDSLAAGAVIAELEALCGEDNRPDLADSARVAALLFENLRGDLYEALATSDHGRLLAELGFDHDLRFCSQLNIPGAPVPIVVGSSIKLYQEEHPDRHTVARFV